MLSAVARRCEANGRGLIPRLKITALSIRRHSTSPQSGNWSVNSEEVKKFEDMAKSWWDPFGPFMPLHQLNPARVKFIREAATVVLQTDPLSPSPLEGRSVLDIGCGGGILAESLARLGGSICAIDASAENVNVAKAHAARDANLSTAIDYRAQTAESLLAEGRSFDLVMASEVLEHVSQPMAFLEVCAALTKPGGMLVVTTINRTRAAFAKTILAAEFLLKLVPKGTHEYAKFVRPEELESALASLGVVTKMKQGVYFDPLVHRWKPTPDLSANYFLAAVKL